MSKSNNQQLVFTLPEALSEIRALRDERAEIRAALVTMKKELGKVANELHNLGDAGGTAEYVYKRLAQEIAKAFDPAKRFIG